jgi:mannosyltransferase OCH1-like enzyme
MIIITIIILIFLFYFIFIKNKGNDNFTNQKKIPQIIHQIWIGPRKKPEKWMKQWENDYIKMYPSYKYIFWNEEKIDNELNWTPKLRKMYDLEQEYYGKSDIARLIILNQYGGIYIDSDSVWVNKKNLDDIIDIAYKENTNNR